MTAIAITRGDSYDGTANNKLSWTVAKDFTSGWTGVFTVRHHLTRDVLLTKAITVVDATTLEVSLDADDTAFTDLTTADDFGPHPYDVEMTETGGSVQTVVSGIATITRDVS